MAMFDPAAQRPAAYQRFVRPVPEWFTDAGLGIFVHWGAYSVPAWAVPLGEHGSHHDDWFLENPYAEWYANTIRIPGSPAAQHHREVFGDVPYDDLLDRWHAEAFDPDALVALFARAGARYVVPTTKHHDGITLWDAPGTGTRNTVARGPRRDLVREFERATRAAGLRFGVYYSGGLDWHAADTGPIWDADDDSGARPLGAEYAAYATEHVRDLIERYAPDVLWGDIDWPDAGKPEGPLSFTHLLDLFYATNPEGVVNDRWGLTHWDFRTSEYQAGTALEGEQAWENCRGTGLSFGYNRNEGPEHSLDGPAAVRHLVDVVSRGGNLLLNVGPDAAGRVPELQRQCLEGLADWMAVNGRAVHDTRPLPPGVAASGEEPWVRWTASRDGEHAFAVVDDGADREMRLAARADALQLGGARLLGGGPVGVRAVDGGVVVDLPARSDLPHAPAGPLVVEVPLRHP
ncbi:alpha-L-fucosidase [Streptomyces sp. NP160]|uniref:alpha-L-fucosidase n=1 Tax=Streptomyces sp. NP160 TaxID=2586637 RepID=UPI00111B0B74|nr:alpha-L-fucosidase [Streptomyces sp. NP160]TNM64337.1 alpha-L-fucosidase [Streptomyces sp. NP160]